MKSTTLAIWAHRGLGDLIICNALFRDLAKTRSNVIIPVKYEYYESAVYMLRDIPAILPVPANRKDDATRIVNGLRPSGDVLFLGNSGTNYSRQSFDKSFYNQAGIPFERRWDGFKLERDVHSELPHPSQPFAFVHDDAERGFLIDRSKPCFSGLSECIPFRTRTNNIFYWIGVILAANEIHCIDSSFALLVDSLILPKHIKLYLHRYSRPAETIPTYRLDWTYLL